MLDTTVDSATAKAIDRAEQRVAPPWDALGKLIDVTFPAANTRRDVQHGLNLIPTGYWIVKADGPVYAAPGQLWTREVAYLQSSVAGTRVRLMFFHMKGDTANAS